MTPFSIIAASLLCSGAWAETHELNWTLATKKIKPDGNKSRQVVSINDQWPLPMIEVNQGDRLVVNVTNDLTKPATNTSVHFYGLFQNGTTDMDGDSMVSQCPEVAKTSFVYNFTVDQPGTYFYELHSDDMDVSAGRQMLLVNNDKAWFKSEVDGDIAISLSDWYNDIYSVSKDKKFMVSKNANGTEPNPSALLMNSTVAPKWEVESSKTYRLRLANIGAYTGFYVYIPNQNFTVIEADGVYTQPVNTSMLYIASGQRYSVLFNTTSDSDAIYQLVQIADQSQYSKIDKKTVLNHTAFLYTGKHSAKDFVAANQSSIYDSAPKNNHSSANVTKFTSSDLAALDDLKLKPYDNQTLLTPVNVNHTLTISTGVLSNKKPYAFFNDVTWTSPKVPTLFSVLSANDNQTASNSTIYGNNTQPIVLNKNDVVQVIVNNNDTAKYPLHLHGHNFQVVARGDEQDEFTPYDPEDDDISYPKLPMRRDTVLVMPNSFVMIRFRADNPGVWLFRTTNDWKYAQGLALEFVEAPADVREHYKQNPLSDSHKTVCSAAKINMTGNAAANTNDYYNLSGQNVQPTGAPIFTSTTAAPTPSVTSSASQRDYDTKSHESDYDTKSHESDYDTKSHESDTDTKSHESDTDTKSHQTQCNTYNYKRYAKDGSDGDCAAVTSTTSTSSHTATSSLTTTSSPTATSQCNYNYKRYAKDGHDGGCEADTDTHSHEQDTDTKTHESATYNYKRYAKDGHDGECYNYKRYAKDGHDGECSPMTTTSASASSQTATTSPTTTSQCYYNYKRYAKDGHDGECEADTDSHGHEQDYDTHSHEQDYDTKTHDSGYNYKRYAKDGHDGECYNYKRYAKDGHDGECSPMTTTSASASSQTATTSPTTTSQCYYNYKRYAKDGHDGECEADTDSHGHEQDYDTHSHEQDYDTKTHDSGYNYKRYAKDGHDGECYNYKRYAKDGHDGECSPMTTTSASASSQTATTSPTTTSQCYYNYKRYAKDGHDGECEADTDSHGHEQDYDTHSHEQDYDTKTHDSGYNYKRYAKDGHDGECYNYKRYAKDGHDGECSPMTTTSASASSQTATTSPTTTSQCYYNYKRYAKDGHDGECEADTDSHGHEQDYDTHSHEQDYDTKTHDSGYNYKRYAKDGHDGECYNYKRYAKDGHDGECSPMTTTSTSASSQTATTSPTTTSQCYYNYKRYAKDGHDGDCDSTEEAASESHEEDCDYNYKRYARDGECEPSY